MRKRYTDSEQNHKVDFVVRDYGLSKIKASIIVILPLLCIFSLYLFGIDNGYVSMVFNCLFTNATVLVLLQHCITDAEATVMQCLRLRFIYPAKVSQKPRVFPLEKR